MRSGRGKISEASGKTVNEGRRMTLSQERQMVQVRQAKENEVERMCK